MRPLLKPKHYTSEHWFLQEQSGIFGRLWVLAAITPMLANHRDYRTLTLAGKPVVLQNHNGTIRAFSNVCRHRMARIQAEEFGNRALVCPYHRWAYNDQGQLIHTHRDPAVFGLTQEETADIRLKQYAVATVGSLVFVNLSDDPFPLNQQFAPDTLELLERYTQQMDSSFIYTRYEGDFNWKTGMENIKDALHVPCLHSSTFPDHFRVVVAGNAQHLGRDSVYSPARSLPEATTHGRILMQGAPVHDWHALVHSLDCQGYYQSFHLFPNVNLMIVDGRSFAIQIYNPLAAGRTEMQMMVALTKQKSTDFTYKPVVLWEHLVSDMTVLQEDIDCLGALQKNLETSNGDFIHGAYETGILDFQAAYLAQMQSATDGATP
jgi:phenylpropionate dioxygenase-like ring-hydroxylating dioxygenase large terminal subunit